MIKILSFLFSLNTQIKMIKNILLTIKILFMYIILIYYELDCIIHNKLVDVESNIRIKIHNLKYYNKNEH